MKFLTAQSTIDYLIHFVSEGGSWECGFHQNDLSLRYWVGAGMVGEQCYEIQYWCGEDLGLAIETLGVVMRIFQTFPEELRPDRLRTMLPGRDDPNWHERLVAVRDAAVSFEDR